MLRKEVPRRDEQRELAGLVRVRDELLQPLERPRMPCPGDGIASGRAGRDQRSRWHLCSSCELMNSREPREFPATQITVSLFLKMSSGAARLGSYLRRSLE